MSQELNENQTQNNSWATGQDNNQWTLKQEDRRLWEGEKKCPEEANGFNKLYEGRSSWYAIEGGISSHQEKKKKAIIPPEKARRGIRKSWLKYKAN